MYRLVVSPTPIRVSYIQPHVYKWFLSAWFDALMITLRNPYSAVDIQKRVST